MDLREEHECSTSYDSDEDVHCPYGNQQESLLRSLDENPSRAKVPLTDERRRVEDGCDERRRHKVRLVHGSNLQAGEYEEC